LFSFYCGDPLGNWVAALAFLFACFTDYLDGLMARLLSQTSKLGQFLDPTADKLLIASTILILAGFGRIDKLTLIPAIVILCREILVSGLREILSEIQVSIPVTELAKWKTAIQMIALSSLMIHETMAFGTMLHVIGEIMLWVAALLTLISGFNYLKAGLKHF
jgi:cardiolipin synthase